MSTVEKLCASAGISWREVDNDQGLAEKLAADIAQCLQQRLDRNGNGTASLVVSGGSTPAPVFKRLTEIDLAWDRVEVSLADERWVAADHEDSNERLVRKTLLVGKASSARFVPLYQTGMQPEQASQTVDPALAAMTQPFTVVILGMGTDGHTASLFPDAPQSQLQAGMDLQSSALSCILHPPSVPQIRISLTRRALLHAENRFLHITGEKKKDVLYQALLESCPPVDAGESVPGGYTEGMKPIVGLLTERPESVTVYWSP